MTGLLIFIGLILVILNVLAIKKQNKSFNGVLGNATRNVKDYDIVVLELRREFSESILELQREVMGLKVIIEKNNVAVKNYENQVQLINKTDIELEKPKVSYIQINEEIYDNGKNEIKNESQIPLEQLPNSNSVKIDEIKRLFKEGHTVDEIAEILHLGKGEVLLIKDLYIR